MNESSICIGFASFLNHSATPNMKISGIDKTRMTKSFITLREIRCGEEITIYYNDKFQRSLE
jgi:SET domain-containing protein